MRIYISGPMTGKPDLNRPAFDAAEKRLTAGGQFVINPHHISELFGTAQELCESFMYYYGGFSSDSVSSLARAVMDADLAAVRSCDAIYLLRGWETSRLGDFARRKEGTCRGDCARTTGHAGGRRGMTARKLSAAISGFVAGVVTWPLVAVVWPFVVVWFLWNEEDDV